MAENSGISWTDHTFNPWMGCTKVSTACKNCYAERDMDHRFGKAQWGDKGTRVLTTEQYWSKPIKWNKEAEQRGVRTRVFCASLSDVFEDWKNPILNGDREEVAICHGCGVFTNWRGGCKNNSVLCQRVPRKATMADVRKRLFELIDSTPNLDWLLLTKRPENVWRFWKCLGCDSTGDNPIGCRLDRVNAPFRKNVWLGTSVENQEYADKRIPELLKCRDLSPVLFLSCEPLLGPVDLTMIATNPPYEGIDSLSGLCFDYAAQETRGSPKIDWVIAGGESGPNARPSHPDWFRSLRDQCQSANVPFHFKQFGEWYPTRQARHSDLSCDAKKQVILKPNGQETTGFLEYGVDSVIMDRVGTKAAGRMLDGVTHDAFPNQVPA